MKFQATEQQIKQIAANAVNASKPMGMGFFHYQAGSNFSADDFGVTDSGLYLDYVEGRMVKLSTHRRKNEWEINDNISADYQSWICKYPTVQDLVNSVVGVSV